MGIPELIFIAVLGYRMLVNAEIAMEDYKESLFEPGSYFILAMVFESFIITCVYVLYKVYMVIFK
jgi:hypothetical protein